MPTSDEINFNNILVTGGTGFLGAHLVKRLLAEGYTVSILKRKLSNLERINDVLNLIKLFDLEDGIDSIFEAGISYDAVFHTATDYGISSYGLLEVIKSNLIFPLELLEKSTLSKVKYFYNIDTAMPSDVNSYALSKKQFFQQWINIRQQLVF